MDRNIILCANICGYFWKLCHKELPHRTIILILFYRQSKINVPFFCCCIYRYNLIWLSCYDSHRHSITIIPNMLKQNPTYKHFSMAVYLSSGGWPNFECVIIRAADDSIPWELQARYNMVIMTLENFRWPDWLYSPVHLNGMLPHECSL